MKAIFDLILPPVCLVCHSRIEKSGVLCESCRDSLALVESGYCRKCGSPIKDEICETCAGTKLRFDFSRSVLQYGDVAQGLIHAMKYRGSRRSAHQLAGYMRDYLKGNKEYRDYDYVTAVPLHRVRRRERGYNQSELLAREVASELAIPYIDAVKRRYYTLSQTNLNREQRKVNLKGAFRVSRSGKISGKRIILIDDVFTTGTTVSEIAGTLHTGGAKQVAVLTACRAG